jgi:predicted RNA-binding Zn ribbon-like protein
VEFDGARWVGPETGATWLDLIATVTGTYGPAPVDRLATAELLRSWFAVENLPPSADPTDADLARARDLRDALRSLALGAVRSIPWSTRDIAAVNKVLAADRPLRLESGEIRPPATAREALARIAREAVSHLTGPAAVHLHQCADEVCGMLFLDPGGRRRWCSAEVCGVRNRVRAHRQRLSVPGATPLG